jgi:hypothetical protein
MSDILDCDMSLEVSRCKEGGGLFEAEQELPSKTGALSLDELGKLHVVTFLLQIIHLRVQTCVNCTTNQMHLAQ